VGLGAAPGDDRPDASSAHEPEEPDEADSEASDDEDDEEDDADLFEDDDDAVQLKDERLYAICFFEPVDRRDVGMIE